VEHTLQKAPERIIAMNQGVVEFLMGLGLGDRIIGTRPLDDYIWPKYTRTYDGIPNKSYSNPNYWNYPDEHTIMVDKADFIIASWSSAYREIYFDAKYDRMMGIFSNATVGPCEGPGSEQGLGGKLPQRTCRPQLNSHGIGTWLLSDACEDYSIRADVAALGEEFVYEEMRRVGKLFEVDAEAKIQEMRDDFDAAGALVSTAMHGKPLTAMWVDCVSCCKVEEGEEPQVYVGAGTGTPNMLMKEAGLTNVFGHMEGLWVCVNESTVAAANPDVFILVDWHRDPALETKITWLYDNPKFCGLDALEAARFVTIPFSASGPSPRNGDSALDLAIAALHVHRGTLISSQESGVSSFNPHTLEAHTKGMRCNLEKQKLKYINDAASIHCDATMSGCASPKGKDFADTLKMVEGNMLSSTTSSTKYSENDGQDQDVSKAFTTGVSLLNLVATAILLQ
jgi:iron complex transport system substrate-binding protein